MLIILEIKFWYKMYDHPDQFLTLAAMCWGSVSRYDGELRNQETEWMAIYKLNVPKNGLMYFKCKVKVVDM